MALILVGILRHHGRRIHFVGTQQKMDYHSIKTLNEVLEQKRKEEIKEYERKQADELFTDFKIQYSEYSKKPTSTFQFRSNSYYSSTCVKMVTNKIYDYLAEQQWPKENIEFNTEHGFQVSLKVLVQTGIEPAACSV